MDKKQELKNVKESLEEIDKKLQDLQEEYYDDPAYEEFEACDSDAERKEKYPNLYAVREKMQELDAEKDTLIEQEEELEKTIEQEEAINRAKERYLEIDEQIEKLEKEIELSADEYNQAMKEIQSLNKKINELKETEEYKNGDEATLKKVKELEAELEKKVKEKNIIVKRLSNKRKEITKLKDEKEQLVEKYGKEILPVQEQQTETQPPATTAERVVTAPPPPVTTAERVVTAPPSTATTAEQVVTAPPPPVTTAEQVVTETPPAATQPDEPKVNNEVRMTKKSFKRLYHQVKKGNITPEDFATLSKIMQDPAKYDELGITTGIVFNKSKVILKNMAKYLSRTDATARKYRSEFGIEEEVNAYKGGYITMESLRDGSGVKGLIENPDKKITSEEVFKIISEMDASSLSESQVALYEEAKGNLANFAGFRKALQTYGDVSKSRTLKRYSWLLEAKETEATPLGAAPDATPANDGLTATLAKQVQDDPNYTEDAPAARKPDDPII